MPALEAVLADIERRGIAQIYCLGDLVGKGPDSDRALDRCREACVATVRGNWDDFITRETTQPTLSWHRQRLGTERLAYLSELPMTVELLLSGKRVRLFHASQESVYTRVHMDDAREIHQAMFTNTDFTGYTPEPDVVGYGDIHGAYIKSFRQRTLFNCGSVGNPLDLTLAAYAILEGRLGSAEPGGFAVQLVRVPYDIELAIRQATDAGMPELDLYAAELRTARYRGKPSGTL